MLFGNSNRISARVKSWIFYDWAISVFSTSVLTVFLNPYLTDLAVKSSDSNGMLFLLGLKIYSGSFFEYVISFSVLLQLFFLPFIGKISDQKQSKRGILMLLTIIGASSVIAMYFIKDGMLLLGAILLIIANVNFGCAMVVYNSFLTDFVSIKLRDKISARGFAIGYLGGGLLLAFHLLLINYHNFFGIVDLPDAIRIAFITSGFWWLIFGIVSVIGFAHPKPISEFSISITMPRFSSIIETAKDLRTHPQVLLFLISYLLFNDGIQTVIIIAGKFASQKIGLPVNKLTLIILLIQIVAFFGSVIIYKISAKYSSKKTLIICLIIWTLSIATAYFYLTTVTAFIIFSIIIALVLGGSQSLSRSIYSKLVPIEKSAEYFSFYELSERGSSWLGPLCFALALQLTHSYNIALLSLVVFFILGTTMLLYVKVPESNISK